MKKPNVKDIQKINAKKPAWMKEFGEFINRGSVVDLAVGVIIGAAFGKIVTSLVDDILMPVIGLIAGGVDFTNLAWEIPNLFGADTAAKIHYGLFLQNIVDFLIVALAVFFFVRAITKAQAKMRTAQKAKEDEEEKQEDENTKLLREIRDSLKKQNEL